MTQRTIRDEFVFLNVSLTEDGSSVPGDRSDQPSSSIAPTSGKAFDDSQRLNRVFADLGKLREKYADTTYVYSKNMAEAAQIQDNTYNLGGMDTGMKAKIRSKAMSTIQLWASIRTTMSRILDPADTLIQDLSQYDNVLGDDPSMLGEVLREYVRELKDNIIPKVKKCKQEILDTPTVAETITPSKPVLVEPEPDKVDKNPTVPARTMQQWVYDFSLYYVRPDNVSVDLTKYINEFVQNMEYDALVMPLYSMMLTVNELTYRDFKDHFETLRFYMSVDKYVRGHGDPDDHIVRMKVLDNTEMVALDPLLNTDGAAEGSPLAGLPSHPLKLDLVSKRNVDINSKVRSKVYRNATMLDVITSLLTDAVNEQIKQEVSDRERVTFTVTPPDNIREYEQVILDPGSLADNIRQLQEKYGVYSTGIRMMMSSVGEVYDESSKTSSMVTLVTVSDKGGHAFGKGGIEQVLIEVVDKVSRVNVGEYESGSFVDKESRLCLVRTQEAYQIDKRNSARILDGESVRVMGSSQDDSFSSECDISENEDSPQRTYWGANDNPYNLTQLQDEIREKALSIAIQCNDVDAYMLNSNMRYVLKFFNNDDAAYSGEYRLKGMQFRFLSEGTMQPKQGVSLQCFLYLTNIPNVTVNGVSMKRPTYSERVRQMREDYAAYKGKTGGNTSGSGKLSASPPLLKVEKKGGPYLPKFAGNTDYNGDVVPKELKPSDMMSDTVKFLDIYTTKDSVDPVRGNYICQDFDLYCYAQKFATKLLDPIFQQYGKCIGGGGKMNSWYRYTVPTGGAAKSSHMWAMAADLALTSALGDSLCEPFHWIATQSGLDFDQVILEGNGKEWRWIHVGMNYNGVNRRQILLINNSLSGNYVRAEKDFFTSPDQAKFADFMTKIR
jgi:hypothetical protein